MASDLSLDRSALVAFAAESVARGSRSFGTAAQLFDRRTRERTCLLYAWARACDDIADGEDHDGAIAVPEGEARERAAEIRRLTDIACAGAPSGHAAFDCLALLMRECPVPRDLVDAMLAGFDLDASGWRPRSEADLMRYCWLVSGSLGAMMAVVMGVPPDDADTLQRAGDLGIALQLTNIARDVADDAGMDLCYLPLEWMVEMDIPPGMHMHPAYRARIAVMARWLAEFVDMYEASAAIGAARLPFRSRWAVLATSRIYGAIADKVRHKGDRAWDHRIATTRAEKAGHILAALAQAVRPSRPDQAAVRRDGLWKGNG